MKYPIIIALILFRVAVNGQTREIKGRVISEYFETLPGVHIHNQDTFLLGKTDMEGRFSINLKEEDSTLLFFYMGMQTLDIDVTAKCKNIEVILLAERTGGPRSHRKYDRLEKRRFDKIPELHLKAHGLGLFKTQTICYQRHFQPSKPILDKIREELKELRKDNKNDFKELNIGDIVKIPIGIDTSENENRVRTHYAPCINCTEEDYDYLIEGEVIKKHKRKLSLDIKITKMSHYDFLKYQGEILYIGSILKYEMKYYEVIINKKQLTVRAKRLY